MTKYIGCLILTLLPGLLTNVYSQSPKKTVVKKAPAPKKIQAPKGAWSKEDVPKAAEKTSNLLYQDEKGAIYIYASSAVYKWDGSTWVSMPKPKGYIDGMSTADGETMYVWRNMGAYESTVDKWNGTSWSTFTQFSKPLHAMVIAPGGKIYAGGEFRNEKDKCYVGCYEGGKWTELGNDSSHLEANSYIKDICVTPNGIYVSGAFTDSNKRSYVARWDGKQWQKVGDNSNCTVFTDVLTHMACDAKGVIYVSGYAKDSGYYSAAKFQNGKWVEIMTGPIRINWFVEDIIVDKNNNVYMAGQFKNRANNTTSTVIKWDGATWDFLAPQEQARLFNMPVKSMVTDSVGNLYTAGNFTNEFGNYFLGKWDINATPDATQSIDHYPVPVDKNVKLGPDAVAQLEKMEIFEENNKKGVRTTKGEVLIKPIFTDISLVAAPDYEKNYKRPYALRLYNFYTLIVEYNNFEDGLHSYEVRSGKCEACKGEGRFYEKEVLSYTPEKTKTETHNTKEYTSWGDTRVKSTTTTTKTAAKTETYTISTMCKVCKGSGKAQGEVLYIWDGQRSQYVKQ